MLKDLKEQTNMISKKMRNISTKMNFQEKQMGILEQKSIRSYMKMSTDTFNRRFLSREKIGKTGFRVKETIQT